MANKLKEYGYKCRRTQQFCGNTGQADDVVGLDYIHIESKRVERLNIDKAIEQAVRDTRMINSLQYFIEKIEKIGW